MKEERLIDLLEKYEKSEMLPFHMPGHKRQEIDYLKKISFLDDITELPDFDDLHHAEGILAKSMQKAAALFGSSRCFYLVNGSTGGILAAMATVLSKGGTVLVSANCHQSVFHAAELLGLNLKRVYPEYDSQRGIYTSLTPEAVQKALEEDFEIRALVVNSPTYEGVVSDLDAICEIVHAKGLPLIVDSAHGAHFGFSPYFPKSAVESGADIVIQSLHKTLPSLTSTALAHLSSKVDSTAFAHALRVFVTSSPSYLLLSSIDGCVHWLSESSGKTAMANWAKRLQDFRERAKDFHHLKLIEKKDLFGCNDLDKGKLLLDCTNSESDGAKLRQILREKYHIETEMHSCSTVLAMTSPLDTDETFAALFSALKEIDENCNFCQEKQPFPELPREEGAIQIRQAVLAEKKILPLKEAVGAICGEMVTPYPPGIPFLLPGEILTEQKLSYLNACLSAKLPLYFDLTKSTGFITVLK